MENECKNCGQLARGSYCENCGQRASIGRITLTETFKQFLSSSFSLEGPLIKTIKGLILNPGKVYREFIEGKRKKYYQPVSFFILLSAIYILVRTFIGYDPLESSMGRGSVAEIPDDMKVFAEAAQYMVKNINYIMFFLVFSTAFMLKLFFWKNYNLAEYLSIGLYIGGIYVIIGTIYMLLSKFAGLSLNQIQLILLEAIIFISCISLFKPRTFGTIFKSIMVSVTSLMFYLIFGYGLSLLIVFLKY